MRSPVPLPTSLGQIMLPRKLLVWLTVQVPFNQMDMPICPSKSQIAGLTGHPDHFCCQPSFFLFVDIVRSDVALDKQKGCKIAQHPDVMLELQREKAAQMHLVLLKEQFSNTYSNLILTGFLACHQELLSGNQIVLLLEKHKTLPTFHLVPGEKPNSMR
ncbi:hypothetical protein P7K49_024236 [Saguinus oedipus]|uniref:Uncharacterized protein n=1 Tax=Saguinus oedipus TaxID=9490 RepID=A0ABQ9UPP8_SAGOE|nr:hypothetical protein P7K49_024236 [Saguinus oedipus]